MSGNKIRVCAEPSKRDRELLARSGKLTMVELLGVLGRCKCYPVISRVGPREWNAHVNDCGSCWGFRPTPLRALREAVNQWKAAGMPIDGHIAKGWLPS